jgi:hypothetical protein
MPDITVVAVPGIFSFSDHDRGATGMAKQTDTLQLNDADIAFLLNLLRNASSPLTTAELIEAFRQRSGR